MAGGGGLMMWRGDGVGEFSSVGLEHLLDMQEVAGSNPVAPTSKS